MVKEMSKLKGVPIMQVMRVGTTANGEPLPAASEAPIPASNGPAMPSAGDVAKLSASSAINRLVSIQCAGWICAGCGGEQPLRRLTRVSTQKGRVESVCGIDSTRMSATFASIASIPY